MGGGGDKPFPLHVPGWKKASVLQRTLDGMV